MFEVQDSKTNISEVAFCTMVAYLLHISLHKNSDSDFPYYSNLGRNDLKLRDM